jgi:hypothetical protein
MLSLCFCLTVTFTMIDYLIIGSGLAGIGFEIHYSKIVDLVLD